MARDSEIRRSATLRGKCRLAFDLTLGRGRPWLLLLLAAGSMVATGCRMCDSSYDYCSATFTGGCDDCRPLARVASVFSDDGSYVADTSPVEPATYETLESDPFDPERMHQQRPRGAEADEPMPQGHPGSDWIEEESPQQQEQDPLPQPAPQPAPQRSTWRSRSAY